MQKIVMLWKKLLVLTAGIICFSLIARSQINYTLPSEPWNESFGNHRAIIEVKTCGDAVGLEFLWRRHDKDPGSRRFIIIEATSGDTIKNIFRYEITNEKCKLAFGPVQKEGRYYIYYLPYDPVTNQYWAGKYLEKEPEPQQAWVLKNKLRGNDADFDKLPKCTVTEIQARTAFNSFYPMEVIATHGEVENYLAKYKEPFLVFPEDRQKPVRMLDALPMIWLQHEPRGVFRGIARRNEYYALQLAVYAAQTSLENLRVNFSNLSTTAGDIIPASSITCFNTNGVDIEGNPFTITVNVPKQKVQPMWIGIDIPPDISPGKYNGIFSVSVSGMKERRVAIEIEVEESFLSDRGDGETWRHSRLRWLNSTIGIDNEPVKPYTPIQVNDRGLSVLGRDIILDEYGLPSQVKSWGNDILGGPVQFVLESGNRILDLEPKTFKFTRKENGIVSWIAELENQDVRLTCNGDIEFDGRLNYKCSVIAKKGIHFQDIRLEIPYRKSIAQYMIGMGRMGGYAPENHLSRWRKEEDSFWLGNEKGGIHCELRGGSYHGPLLNLYQPEPPASWFNGVNGGFRVETTGDILTAKAFSGYRSFNPGEEVKFEFALIITPVKKYNPADQFEYKYVHTPFPDEKVIKSGGNVMNVHHANEFNPYINYPFLANERLKGLVDEWHEKNWKVKIYYTVRELSNHITEIWALRSLGYEVLADGAGGGYQWLQEHMVSNYNVQWYTHLGNGEVDAAIMNAGESRWYNYYLEGLAWLLKEIDIDGLYLDDFSYDRRILKRMRKIMESIKPGECLIDVHSNTAFTRGPVNQYLEIYPFIDRTWYGEGFNFDFMPPDFWLTEVSGVPFGVVNELLLHRSVNDGRRGMLFAMVPRGDWGMWNFWREFGITESRMIGFWEEADPVKTTVKDVYITCYLKQDSVLLVLGSWLMEPVQVKLDIDWKKLGIDPKQAKITIPAIKNHQKEERVPAGLEIQLEPRGEKFIVITTD